MFVTTEGVNMNVGDYIKVKDEISYGFIISIDDDELEIRLVGNGLVYKNIEEVEVISESIEHRLDVMLEKAEVYTEDVKLKLEAKEKSEKNKAASIDTISRIENWFKEKPCCKNFKINYKCDSDMLSINNKHISFDLPFSDENFADKLQEYLGKLCEFEVKKLKERKIENELKK